MAFLFRITFAVWAIMGPALAGELVWKTEEFGANCKEVPQTAADQGEGDFVEYKCTSTIGPPMWLIYQDSARMNDGTSCTVGGKPDFRRTSRWQTWVPAFARMAVKLNENDVFNFHAALHDA